VNVRWQRRLTQLFHPGEVEDGFKQNDPSALTQPFGGHHRPAVIQEESIADSGLGRGTKQTFPYARAAIPEQQQLKALAGGAFREHPGRNHPGVVEQNHVIRIQITWQVLYHPMLHPTSPPIEHKHAGLASRHGVLRDQLLRQFVVEIGRTHPRTLAVAGAVFRMRHVVFGFRHTAHRAGGIRNQWNAGPEACSTIALIAGRGGIFDFRFLILDSNAGSDADMRTVFICVYLCPFYGWVADSTGY